MLPLMVCRQKKKGQVGLKPSTSTQPAFHRPASHLPLAWDPHCGWRCHTGELLGGGAVWSPRPGPGPRAAMYLLGTQDTYPLARPWAGRSGLVYTGAALERWKQGWRQGPGRHRAPSPTPAPSPQGPERQPLTLPDLLPAGPPVAQQQGARAKCHRQHQDHAEENRAWKTGL